MNRLKEQFKKSASVNGSYSVGAIVLVLCVVVLVNMLASRLPESVRKVDVSDNKIYEITDTSKKLWLNHKFCGISDSSRSSVGSYRIASERNIRHQDIRIPVCEES